MNHITGLVLRSTGGLNVVKIDTTGEIVECAVRGKIRLKGIRTTNPVAPGDRVLLQFDSMSKQAVIVGIDQRKNYIVRRSTNLSKESQVLAANLDRFYAIATVSLPETTLMFIDRMLVTAEAYDIEACLVFNKIDLCRGKLLEKLAEYSSIYSSIGYRCFFTSTLTGEGIGQLRDDVSGKISLFVGHSGVGKSSILNSLVPGANLKIGEISEVHKQGKHTTTFASMIELPDSGYIVDSPGIRAFGLVDIDPKELSHFFPEIFKASEKCRFYNCTHTQEPGCEVVKAVEHGNIPESRYRNYVSIFYGRDDEKYRLDDYS